MRIITLLNQCQKHKSFFFAKEYIEKVKGQSALIVEIHARKNSNPICNCCGKSAAQYDQMKNVRDDQFIPAWGYQVYFRYKRRRVNCKKCGVKVEQVPWCEEKQKLTKDYKIFLSQWARRLSWKGISDAFHTSWDNVYQSVKYAVSFGMENRNLDNIEAIGVDEVQHGKGHQYITLVYQLDEGNKRLLYIGKSRTAKTLLRFFF